MNLPTPPEKLVLFKSPDILTEKYVNLLGEKLNEFSTFSHELVEYIKSKDGESVKWTYCNCHNAKDGHMFGVIGCKYYPSPESEVDVKALLEEYGRLRDYREIGSGNEVDAKRMSEIEEIIRQKLK